MDIIIHVQRLTDDKPLAKKANSGDMSAMSEYLSMLENAQRLADKLEDADDAMTTKQIARYERITSKLSKAAANM